MAFTSFMRDQPNREQAAADRMIRSTSGRSGIRKELLPRRLDIIFDLKRESFRFHALLSLRPPMTDCCLIVCKKCPAPFPPCPAVSK